MIKIYGANWCPDCQTVKKFFGEHGLSYSWIDIDQSPAAAAEVEKINHGLKLIPTIIFEDGSHLTEPSLEQIADKLKTNPSKTHDYHDLVIVGGGPTGLTTAIYATREGIHTAVVEGKVLGGQTGITDQIDNYPGFPEGVPGLKLAEDMTKQAKKFGTEIISENTIGLRDGPLYKKIIMESGKEITSRVVLIATGSDYKRLGVAGEAELIGKGVHFCATCDGPFYKNKEITIIGGGNSALQEGMFLTRFASQIEMIVRAETLSGSQILQDNVRNDPKFKINYNLETVKLTKRESKIVITAKNLKTGEIEEHLTDGVFVFIGLKPNTAWLKDSGIQLDDRGFVKTNKSFETNLEGVFAAGDCRAGATAQIASAVGEGATAALMIRYFLKTNG